MTHDRERPARDSHPSRDQDVEAAPVPGRTRRGDLPAALQDGIERLSGVAMDDVTIHRESGRPAELGAAAFAQGSEIHLGPGAEHHLAHEAWHVVQQKQGRVAPTMQMGGAEINDSDALEAEADTMGALAAAIGAEPAGDR